ncbi:HDOD domain-containing protein [soil metagenome]
METEFFTIERLVKTELPPLPASVMRISAMLSDMNISQNAVADAISLDPILSTRILRLANSPVYGQHGTVTNLTKAVSAVGNNAISEALLINGISDSFGRKILSSDAGKEIWFHLLATAMAAGEICRIANMRGVDEAFSCALLHDIGKLILLRADAPFYIKLMERGMIEGDLTAVEREVFGFDHAELGAEAALTWNLPPAVCHMIRYHHQPAKVSAGVAMAHIINIADQLVTLKSEGSDMEPLASLESVKNLQLNAEKLDAVWHTIAVRLNEVMDTFA